MRRYLTSLFFLLSLAIAGCMQNDIVPPDGQAPAKDIADMDLIVEDSDYIIWEEGDELSVLSSADTKTNNRFVVSSKEGSAATASGQLVGGRTLCAVYPFTESCVMTVDGTMHMLSSIIPAEQTEDGVSDVYVSVSDNGRFVFYPTTAKARVTVKVDGAAEEIAKVSVSGNNGESLAGPVQIMAFPGGRPVMMTPAPGGGAEVAMNGTWTVGAETPLVLEIGLAPGNLSKGYSINVIKSDGVSANKAYDTNVSFSSNETTDLDEFVLVGPKFYFEYTADAKLDVSGYKNEYDSSTSTGRLWFSTSVIPEEILKGNQSVKGVHIPASITEVGAGAFENCIALNSLTFDAESDLKTIHTTAFRKTALVEIAFPSSLTNLKVQAFQGITGLKRISFPADSKLKRIEQGTFNGNTVLEELVLPASVEFLDRCFNNKYVPKINVTLLATVPPKVGDKGNNVFNKNGIKKIYVPAESLDAYKSAWHADYKDFFAAIPE